MIAKVSLKKKSIESFFFCIESVLSPVYFFSNIRPKQDIN